MCPCGRQWRFEIFFLPPFPMVLHAERVKHVASPRGFAQDCGVQLVRDQASRAKVAAMMAAVRANNENVSSGGIRSDQTYPCIKRSRDRNATVSSCKMSQLALAHLSQLALATYGAVSSCTNTFTIRSCNMAQLALAKR